MQNFVSTNEAKLYKYISIYYKEEQGRMESKLKFS